jgi:hypothetical protein
MPWQISYALFALGMLVIGGITAIMLNRMSKGKNEKLLKKKKPIK